MEIEGSIKFADLPEGAQSAVRNVAAYFTMQFDNNDWGPSSWKMRPRSVTSVPVISNTSHSRSPSW